MAVHIGFPSINQFREVIRNVTKRVEYRKSPTPILTFSGTVKIHGTNGGIVYDPVTDELWCQSREHIITVEKDNAGFAFFVKSREDFFRNHMKTIAKRYGNKKKVVVFGEFAGGSIQKGVAIAGLEKFFVVFAIYLAESDENKVPTLEIDHEYFYAPELNIYTSKSFKTWTVDIDFSLPNTSVELLEKLTLEVEEECPVGKHFGVSGIGEGIVWTCHFDGIVERFKTKGQKHSVSKVKKGTGIAAISPEVQNSIDEFVKYAVTEQRLEQGIQRVFTEKGIEPEISKTADYLRWVFSDVMKEEHDVLFASKLEPKQVSGVISKVAREYFMKKISI